MTEGEAGLQGFAFFRGMSMDQPKESSENQELRKLLREVLKVQELILHRVDQVEDKIAQLNNK